MYHVLHDAIVLSYTSTSGLAGLSARPSDGAGCRFRLRRLSIPPTPVVDFACADRHLIEGPERDRFACGA
jgi:hypothetical protein